jgi:hypothetical protein
MVDLGVNRISMIKAISENKNAIKRLVIKDKYLKAGKYPLADIITAPDFVAEKVRAYLRSFGYHNLARPDLDSRTGFRRAEWQKC